MAGGQTTEATAAINDVRCKVTMDTAGKPTFELTDPLSADRCVFYAGVSAWVEPKWRLA